MSSNHASHSHHVEDEFLDENTRDTLTLKKYFKNIFDALWTAVKGIGITTKYIWAHDPVTLEYPEVKEILPARSRSRLFNDVDNCIACTQCALACPVDCIYLASVPRPKDAPVLKTDNGKKGNGTVLKLDLTQFVIDTSLCCYCGLCTVVCPTECLTHTQDYEYSQYTLDQMKYDYLSPEVKAWKERVVK